MSLEYISSGSEPKLALEISTQFTCVNYNNMAETFEIEAAPTPLTKKIPRLNVLVDIITAAQEVNDK